MKTQTLKFQYETIVIFRIVVVKIYYHPDHLGSTTLITNSSSAVVEETFYDPYGEILEGGSKSRYQYEGKEFSSATEDYDFHFRKYNPEMGIFTQPEQIFPNVYDPQQLNRYRFERNNPYKYVDETGKVAQVALAILGVGVIAGLIAADVYTISSIINNQKPTPQGFGTHFTGGFFAGTIGAGTATIAYLTGGTAVAALGGLTAGIGAFTAGTNSQLFTNAASGRPLTENTLSSGLISTGTYGAGRYLPTPPSVVSSQFFLNNIIENYVSNVVSSIYNFFTGSSGSQQSTQQINSAQQQSSSASGGSSSGGTIYLNNPSSSYSSIQGSSSGGDGGIVNKVVNSIKNFVRGLF